MERKYINRHSLMNCLKKVQADGVSLYAPVARGEQTDFRFITSVDEISFGHIQTTRSAKAVVFPCTEKLFSYKKEKNDVKLRDYDADELPDILVFGIHPCDAVGFGPLAGIFNWDTQDKPYNERRKRITLISLACNRADEYCFCTSVGGGPGNTEGSDIQLTPVKEDGYLVEIITDKGNEWYEKYGSFFENAAEDIRKEDYLVEIPVKFDMEDIIRKVSGVFENDTWRLQSERCIGCGACAFVCPTCACFDIQEDAHGKTGNRIRCWDSCGFALFTLHTSGHNPRPKQSQRWRQRIMHKFSYMPERLSVVGCTGCGRCSRACPVDMNLSDNLKMLNLL
ncbi:MAG: 4Fe-4S dicluster domain-containing protein [Candidatus Azobacteroides sp.]|nr:4Fe-4S dicluster domain-containing protein [Candidatus Azobacteroides sp.]